MHYSYWNRLHLNRLHKNATPGITVILCDTEFRRCPYHVHSASRWTLMTLWFANIEARLDIGAVSSSALLRNADGNWRTLDDADFIMEERRNDGGPGGVR
jgi:hypothetical protein